MTEAPQPPGPRVPLGVGDLVARSFGLFLRRMPLFLGIAALPSIISVGLQLGGDPLALGLSDPAQPARPIAILLPILFGLLLSMLVVGAITLAAYDARLGRPVRVGHYVGRTLTATPAIVVLGIVLYAIVTLGLFLVVFAAAGVAVTGVAGLTILSGLAGMVLLIGLGPYIMARYWVLVPAILVEHAGFRGLSRAAELTRGYRWPILGAVVLTFLLTALIYIGLTMALGAAAYAISAAGSGAIALMVVVQGLIAAVQVAILSIFTALLYARLREIKEGLGMEELSSVFE